MKVFEATISGKGEVRELGDLETLQGVVKYPNRIKCATLTWTAFQRGLEGERGSREEQTTGGSL